MPKLRKRITRGSTIISNTALRDTRLGSSERWLSCTMMSMADDRDLSIRGFAAILYAVRSSVHQTLFDPEVLPYLL